MMNKVKKLALVIVLTCLIWSWAYLSSDKSIEKQATLTVSQATNPALRVTFNGTRKIDFKITIDGPAQQVSDLEQQLAKGEEKLEFVFNAEEQQMVTPGKHSLNMLQFLKSSDKMTGLGLSVESCSPEKIDVMVDQLVERVLPVHCYDENGLLIEHEKITPPTVMMFVPAEWDGEMLESKVRLSQQLIDSARKEAISQQPYVELIAGSPTYSEQAVSIKLPSTKTPLETKVLRGADLAIGYVYNIRSSVPKDYNVVLSNEDELTEVTQFEATQAAINAYKSQAFQILVEIKDSDVNSETEITRPVIYNFPQSFVSKNEIKLLSQPTMARFRLVKPNTATPAN